MFLEPIAIATSCMEMPKRKRSFSRTLTDISLVGNPFFIICVISFVFKRSRSTFEAISISAISLTASFLEEIPTKATTLPIPPDLIRVIIGRSAPCGNELIELIVFSTSLNNSSISVSVYALIVTVELFSLDVEFISSISAKPFMACSTFMVTPSSISFGEAPG